MIYSQSMSQGIKAPPLDFRVLYQSWRTRFPQKWSIEHDGDDIAFLVEEGSQFRERSPIPAEPMLRRFLNLRSEMEILEFLKKTGFSYWSGRVDSKCVALHSEIRLLQSLLKDAA